MMNDLITIWYLKETVHFIWPKLLGIILNKQKPQQTYRVHLGNYAALKLTIQNNWLSVLYLSYQKNVLGSIH